MKLLFRVLAARLVVALPPAPIFVAAAMLCLVGAGKVHAVTIGIDLGPSRVITGTNPETNKIGFDGLNGTAVVGSVSVDFLFTNNEFARLFTLTQPSFEACITLQTNGSGFLGFLDGTGYLIDAQGNAIPGFGVTGAGSGSDASLGIGLFPLFKDGNGTPDGQLQKPLDFYGIHFDLTFPSNPSIEVTGGQFMLADNGTFTPFAIGPGPIPADITSVPDVGNTSLLLGIALAGLLGLRIKGNLNRGASVWPVRRSVAVSRQQNRPATSEYER